MAEREADGGPAGVVAEVWRYPVKSMQGERLERCEIGLTGLAGDRRYGLIGANGALLTAKSVPELFEAGARTEGADVIITLPDGRELGVADPDASTRLSGWLGREVHLRQTGPGAMSFELSFDPSDDDAELVMWPARADSFLDSAPVNLLSTSSLARLTAVAPRSVWDVRRFRPNLLVDTDPGDGFAEDGWIGHDMAVGGATVHVGSATARCAMPLRAQPAWGGRPALARDLAVLKTLTAEHDYLLGVYGDVVAAGTVTVGDPVHLRL